MVFGRV
jgi:hypothetical protein